MADDPTTNGETPVPTKKGYKKWVIGVASLTLMLGEWFGRMPPNVLQCALRIALCVQFYEDRRLPTSKWKNLISF